MGNGWGRGSGSRNDPIYAHVNKRIKKIDRLIPLKFVHFALVKNLQNTYYILANYMDYKAFMCQIHGCLQIILKAMKNKN
jgi:hypothetical protein